MSDVFSANPKMSDKKMNFTLHLEKCNLDTKYLLPCDAFMWSYGVYGSNYV